MGIEAVLDEGEAARDLGVGQIRRAYALPRGASRQSPARDDQAGRERQPPACPHPIASELAPMRSWTGGRTDRIAQSAPIVSTMPS